MSGVGGIVLPVTVYCGDFGENLRAIPSQRFEAVISVQTQRLRFSASYRLNVQHRQRKMN
jgi:hypothetical protein